MYRQPISWHHLGKIDSTWIDMCRDLDIRFSIDDDSPFEIGQNKWLRENGVAISLGAGDKWHIEAENPETITTFFLKIC